MNIYTVYCHQNKINNKYYIGITSQKPQNRWGKNGHNYQLQPKFYRAIEKYGWNNFNHIILNEKCTISEALALEANYIQQYNSITNGYNISPFGGVGYCKQVLCITTNKVYNSVNEAALDVNISASSISHCLHGDQYTAGKINNIKLEWCFIIDEFNQDKQNKLKIKKDKAIEKKETQLKEAEIYKNEYLNNHMTITSIANKYHTSKATVSTRLKSIGINVIPSQIMKRKPVEMYDLNQNLLKTFATSTEALQFLGLTDSSISRLKLACDEHWRIFKGYHWKYKE